jgi:hypothetical protein
MFALDDNDGGLLLLCLFVKILELTVVDSAQEGTYDHWGHHFYNEVIKLESFFMSNLVHPPTSGAFSMRLSGALFNDKPLLSSVAVLKELHLNQ